MSLLTLAVAKEKLRISHTNQDTVLQIELDAAENWIAKYCNVYFNAAGASVTEYMDGGGLNLWPEKGPIVSVTSVYDVWAEYTFTDNLNTDWNVYRADGIRWPEGHLRHRLIYVPGYTAATLPAEIKKATMDYLYRCYHGDTEMAQSWKPWEESDFLKALAPFKRGKGCIG